MNTEIFVRIEQNRISFRRKYVDTDQLNVILSKLKSYKFEIY